MSTGRFAFDIETISPQLGPNERPDFQNPEHFEFFSVCCAYQSEPDADIEHKLFIRDGEPIITYNGDGFDFIHLRGRAEISADRLGDRHHVTDRVGQLLGTHTSDDLQPESWDTFGEYTSLEGTCEQCGVDVP